MACRVGPFLISDPILTSVIHVLDLVLLHCRVRGTEGQSDLGSIPQLLGGRAWEANPTICTCMSAVACPPLADPQGAGLLGVEASVVPLGARNWGLTAFFLVGGLSAPSSPLAGPLPQGSPLPPNAVPLLEELLCWVCVSLSPMLLAFLFSLAI